MKTSASFFFWQQALGIHSVFSCDVLFTRATQQNSVFLFYTKRRHNIEPIRARTESFALSRNEKII